MLRENEPPYIDNPKSILRFGENILEIKEELKKNIEAKIENIQNLQLQNITHISLKELLDVLESKTKKHHIYESAIEDIADIAVPHPSDTMVKNLSSTERQIYHRNINSLRQFSWIYSRSDILCKRIKPKFLPNNEGSEFFIEKKRGPNYPKSDQSGRYINREDPRQNFHG